MSSNIILVAETGSDITPELAKEYGIWLVPMYVTMGDQTLMTAHSLRRMFVRIMTTPERYPRPAVPRRKRLNVCFGKFMKNIPKSIFCILRTLR